jgi:uncharacterized membrane protein
LISRRLRGALSISFALAVTLLPSLVPGTLAASGLSLTTQFPSVTVTPGTKVSVDLAVDAKEAANVSLSLTGVPSTWTAALHGGGYIVNAVHVNGSSPTTVRLDVSVPSDATGTTRLTVTATATGSTVVLPIDIKAEVGAGGELTLDTDTVALQGAASESFNFTLTLKNDKEEDVTFSTTATGPDNWDVSAKATAQTQAVTAVVKAGAVAQITVAAKPPADVQAGKFPISLTVNAGDTTLTKDLEVDITGSYTMTLTTPTGVLSTRGSAGGTTDQQFVITNTGSAPLTKVVLTATPPTDWKVTFDPASTDTLAPGATANVTAHIVPTTNAIAGDYTITFNASSAESDNKSADIRFTVEASIVGAVLGIALIVAAIGGLFWVFRRYGRR